MATKEQRIVAAGTAMLIAEPAFALMHGGGVGFIAGIAVGAAAYLGADDIERALGKDMPSLPASDPEKPSLVYRMLNGKSVRGEIEATKRVPDTQKPSAPRTSQNLAEIRKNIVPPGHRTVDTESIPAMQRPSEMQPGFASVFPQYPDDETLRLGVDTKKKRRFDPWVNDLFGKGMIASAVQGSGKSMLCGLLIEQAAKCGVPAIIFDHKGEYAGIAELPFVNGLRAGSDILHAKIGADCFELFPANADDFVQLLMEERRQAVIHLPSYGDGWVDRAEVVAGVGQALMRYSSRQREIGNLLLPCLVFMDEAQLYIPQNPALLPPEAQRNKDILDSLNNAYFALVSNGRSNGYTTCFATQSLTYIAKWAIKSCQIRVLMRHTEKNDLDMCEQIINPSVATREEIEAFPNGTGVVFGFTPKPMVVKFDKRLSRDVSETPGIERLRMKQRAAETPKRFEEDEAEEMVDRRAEQSHMSRYSSPRLNPTLEKALAFYNEGFNTSRSLGGKMNVGKDTANGYIRQLRDRKLIV